MLEPVPLLARGFGGPGEAAGAKRQGLWAWVLLVYWVETGSLTPPKGPGCAAGGGQRLGQPGCSPTPLLLSTWLRGSPRLEGTGLRRPLSLASWTRPPARSSGDQGWAGGASSLRPGHPLALVRLRDAPPGPPAFSHRGRAAGRWWLIGSGSTHLGPGPRACYLRAHRSPRLPGVRSPHGTSRSARPPGWPRSTAHSRHCRWRRSAGSACLRTQGAADRAPGSGQEAPGPPLPGPGAGPARRKGTPRRHPRRVRPGPGGPGSGDTLLLALPTLQMIQEGETWVWGSHV